MTNSKTTKRALLSSVVALLLCFTMLLGTTFAWFTDTSSTSVNTIQAGTLDVELQMKDSTGNWVTAEGQTLSFTSNYWEPGCTYSLPELRIINNGNLALKYKVAITGIKGDEKLNEVIDWTISGVVLGHEYQLTANETHDFTISGHMQETAGNDYMGLKIESIAITVYATQATYEVDGTGENTYDKDAAYNDGTSNGGSESTPGTDTGIKTLSDLKGAITSGNSVINLGASIELDGQLNFGTVTINGNGYSLTNAPVSVGSGSTINNVVFDNPVSSYNQASNLYCNGSLTVNNCTFKNTQWDSIQVVPSTGDTVTINGCSFSANSSGAKRFIHVEAAKNSNTNVTINITNNNFGVWSNTNDDIIGLYFVQLSGINFGGNNTFADSSDLVAGKIWICGESSALTISGADAYTKFTTSATVSD